MRPATALERNTTFRLEPLGPFSLRAAARFWSGFTPATHDGLTVDQHLHMAFPVEGRWSTTAGVCVREDEDGSLVGRVYTELDARSGASRTVDSLDGEVDVEAVRRQTARILSLDVDGRGFPGVGRRDPVAAELQRRFPGLRPVCFYSPYEAAAWAILSHRLRREQAARIKARLSEALGEVVSIHGEAMRAFPAPRALASLEAFPGLFGRKPASLRAVASAAEAGRLGAASLRSLPDEQALAQLQELPGIGPFGAQLILLRGAGHPDFLTFLEPKFRAAVRRAYHLSHEPTDDDLRHLAAPWRPYRMWQTFLLRQQAQEEIF